MGRALSLSRTKLLVGVFFYNPPDSDYNTLIQLKGSLASIKSNSPVVLCGDFNMPGIDWSNLSPSPNANSKEAVLLCDIVSDFSLQQLVLEETRGTNILDLLLTNMADYFKGVEVTDGLPGADHNAIEFTIDLTRKCALRRKRLSYNFKRADFDLYS